MAHHQSLLRSCALRMPHKRATQLKRPGSVMFSLAIFCVTTASAAAADSSSRVAASTPRCLPEGGAYFRARLAGAVATELDWKASEIECSGSLRPSGGGLRIRFRHSDAHGASGWVVVFGITGLKEGESAKALPVNVTLIREGGEIFATQGDDKCTVDEVKQQLLPGAPTRKRAYRVEARGFCTQPARALKGEGSILMTRFDYAGRAEFEADETAK